jgi:hypothetical protein
MCFVRLSEHTAIISLYSINCVIFIIEMKCVYCAVRTGSLNTKGKLAMEPQSWNGSVAILILNLDSKRLRWSRGIVLAFVSRVRTRPKPSDF